MKEKEVAENQEVMLNKNSTVEMDITLEDNPAETGIREGEKSENEENVETTEKKEEAKEAEEKVEKEVKQETEKEVKHETEKEIKQETEKEIIPPLCDGDDEMNDLLTRIASQIAVGRIGEDLQTLLRHALSYERDVAQARHDGEVEGRNQRIREYLIEQRTPQGIHNLEGGATITMRDVPAECLGGLQAADRRSIWQRGNERRIVR